MAIALGLHAVGTQGFGPSVTASGTGQTSVNGSTFVFWLCTAQTYEASGTLTDTAGNTWVRKVTDLETGGAGIYDGLNVWVAQNGLGAANHSATFALSSGNLYGVCGLIEITGAASASFDQLVNTNPGGNTTSPTTGTATTTSANEFLLALFCAGQNITFSAPTNGFTLGGQGGDGGGNVCGAYSYNVVSSTGSYSTGLTLSGAENTSQSILTFIAASGGSSATGTSATTDGADTMSASGGIAIAGTSGTTDGADVTAASGGIATAGTSATTDGADTMSAAGVAGASGIATVTDGADTMSASGALALSGTSAVTDSADAMSGAGGIATTGTSVTTDGPDTATASGGIATSGTSATTDDVDVMNAAGSAGAAGVGAAAMSDGADTMDATTPRGGAGRVLPTRKRRKRYVVEDGLEVLYFDTEPQALAAIQARKEVRATEGAPPVQEEPREEELEEAIADPEPLLPDTDFRAHELAGEEEAVARWHIQQERAHHRAILANVAQIISALLDEAA